VPCDGWRRHMTWCDTGLPWVLPSPNLPTPESCLVYPGMVLLEGTNLSEGRGTTRPFELFGAPYLEPHDLLEALRPRLGPGVVVRPCHFEPTFQKHAGAVCGGGQLHVTEPQRFESVATAVAVLAAVKEVAGDAFGWREPPYEYEERLAPIDILWGHDGLRSGIDAGADVGEILDGVDDELAAFERSVGPYLLYD